MSNDPVNHPEHYETNGIECIDAMVASQGKEAVSNYCICNAFKYIWRHQHKGKSIEDIQKAIWYLNKYVEFNEDQDSKYDFTEDELNKVLNDFTVRVEDIRFVGWRRDLNDPSKICFVFNNKERGDHKFWIDLKYTPLENAVDEYIETHNKSVKRKNHQEIDADKLIDDLSKLNPIFSDTFPCWENDHILSIYTDLSWMYYNSSPLYQFDFNKITRGEIIHAFSTEETPDIWDGITDMTQSQK